MGEAPVADRVAGMIAHYYGEDPSPFLALCDEGTLWFGPGEGQVIEGRAALEAAMRGERRDLAYTVSDVEVSHLRTVSPDVHAVAATYRLETVWPDGTASAASQRASFTFSVTGGGPRIVHCHLSDAVAQPAPAGGMPAPARYLEPAGGAGTEEGRTLRLRGVRGAVLYVPSRSVSFVESKGRHALLHTDTGDLESRESVSELDRAYPGAFVRCHQSYLVNPGRVAAVRRFQVVLDDGTRLPVPEKRYARVKAELEERLGGPGR